MVIFFFFFFYELHMEEDTEKFQISQNFGKNHVIVAKTLPFQDQVYPLPNIPLKTNKQKQTKQRCV